MKQDLRCLRCNAEMAYLKTEKIQLGKTSFLWGDWPNLIAGALQVEIYACPLCGKLEFYREPDEVPEADEALPQRQCPSCGRSHDFDYPQCPYCGHSFFGR